MEQFAPENFLILVVDDISRNIQVVVDILDDVGYATTFATSGKQALERVETAQPDLILLDLMMPEIDGLEVCKRLKASAEYRDIPIIFLTASHENEHILEAFQVGAVDYITKPFNASELLARVHTHLDLKHTRDHLRKALFQLNKSKEEALEAARIKAQFLANMSHEIRTPMNAVLGMTELLLKTPLNPQQLDFLQTLKSSGEDLLMIINDILDFSKLEAGEMRLERKEFSLKKVIEQLFSLVNIQAKTKNLQLSYEIDPEVPLFLVGDSSRLRQVLLNLLGNSIKFTERGSVSLKVSLKNLQNELDSSATLYFVVQDTGIGIAPQDQKKLFQSFSQLDNSTTRQYGGTGLGLAICQQLVGLMNGQIGVDSQLNQGSNFWFTARFQVANYPIIETEQPFPNLENLVFSLPQNTDHQLIVNKHKLLLVEDTLINQKVLLNQLRVLGYEADCVRNGQEALELLAQANYDLIFMDCQMPILDGYKTTEILRQWEQKNNNSQLYHRLIIGLTAYAMQGDREKCIAAGMDDYLSKPVSIDDLSLTLHKWLKKSPKPSQKSPESDLAETVISAEDLSELLDQERFEEVTAGDQEFGRYIIQMFMEDLEVYLGEIKTYFQAKEFWNLANKAHQIKGGAANLGIKILPEIAQKIEKKGLNDDLEGLEEMIEALETVFIKLKQSHLTNHL